ncbi:unnamed protein product, partial [Rotaria magnacalcarata]
MAEIHFYHFSSYATKNGSAKCDICPVGHHCVKADESPKPCSPGTFNDLNGQVSCRACADGNYSAYPGAVVCDLCPIGSYCDEKDEPPKPCPAGFFCLEGQTVGTPCPTGYQTTLTGQSYCRICSP